ncbi:MAG TPA: FtsX-like permease family protein [Acidimicrobiales bacterium]
MTLLMAWLRLERRRRWRSFVVLAVMVALATGTVLASVAGARRGNSAAGRLLARTVPATVVVVPNQSGFDWAAVRSIPRVESLTLFPGYTGLTIAGIDDDSLTSFIPADSDAMHTIERPVVLEGRLANPTRPDEAVVTAAFLRRTGHHVGDALTALLTTPQQADAAGSAEDVGPPAGPRAPLWIVGVVRSLWYSDAVGGRGSVIPSPGLLRHYRANLLGAWGSVPLSALVRLRGGEADLAGFKADLARVSGRPDIDVLDRADAVRHARDVTAFESASLLAFGLAALLAAVVIVGQAVVGYAASSAAEMRPVAALGMTSGQGVLLTAAAPSLAATVGAGLGVAGAAVASRWMPFGVAAAYEPSPGIDLDWVVLGAGWLLVAGLVAIASAAAARMSQAAVTRHGLARPSQLATAAARSGAPVPLVIGMRYALEPRPGRDAVLVRPTLLCAVTGILGVVAAFTFSAGVADAADHHARFGQTYQVQVIFGFGGHDVAPTGPVLSALAADPAVAGITDLRVAAGTSGATSVVTHTFDPVGPPSPMVLTAGAPPTADGDVVLAPTTAGQLGARVGSTIPLSGDRGRSELRVTGIGFTVQSSTSGYDRGAWLTPADHDRLFGGFKEHAGLLTLGPGVQPAGVVPRLQRTAATASGGKSLLFIPPFVPPQIGEVKNVRVLPVLLGAFLAVLALGAIAHALAVAVRRRGRDIAVLRGLGLTRRQCRLLVTAQATVITGIGLAAGLPLGLALGRTLWRDAAGRIPLRYKTPPALGPLLLITLLALLVTTVVAAWPGRRAARLPINEVLRTE